jgi:hypothetical protein
MVSVRSHTKAITTPQIIGTFYEPHAAAFCKGSHKIKLRVMMVRIFPTTPGENCIICDRCRSLTQKHGSSGC